MKRITIRLPDELDVRLRLEAKRRSVSIGNIGREAIKRQLPPARPQGRLSFFAIGEGSEDDASDRIDEFVGEILRHRIEPAA